MQYFSKGSTALHKAAEAGRLNDIEVILADGEDVNVPDNDQCSPLHYAALHDQFDAIKLLVSRGAKLDVVDTIGETPCHYAAHHGTGAGIEALVSEGGASIIIVDTFGNTPLHYASAYGTLSAVKVLLDLGANINATYSDGSTPLGCVMACNHECMTLKCALLVDHGASLDSADFEGFMSMGNTILLENAAAVTLLNAEGAVWMPTSLTVDVVI